MALEKHSYPPAFAKSNKIATILHAQASLEIAQGTPYFKQMCTLIADRQ